MKPFAFGLASATVVSFGAFAQSKGENEVAAADKSWAEAYQGCKMDVMGRLLSDDLLFIHLGSNLNNKEQFMKSVSTCNMESATQDVQRIRVYGDAAVVHGTLHYKVKNMAGAALMYTRVYVKKNGAWQLVNHQSTAVPAPKPTTPN